jgi:hypothetical protein
MWFRDAIEVESPTIQKEPVMAIDIKNFQSRVRGLQDERDSALAALSNFDDQLTALRTLFNVDPVPAVVIGRMRNLRYAANDAGKFRQTFTLDTETGMKLLIDCSSEEFEGAFSVAGMTTDKLDGRLIKCGSIGNKTARRFIPLTLLPEFEVEDSDREDLDFRDCWSQPVWPGARVIARPNESGVAVGDIGMIVNVSPDNDGEYGPYTTYEIEFADYGFASFSRADFMRVDE